MSNKVYIATSLDGYIADRESKLEWLHDIPTEEGEDMGYGAMMEWTDAFVMGRRTYQTVLGFDIPWPYDKPVFILSNTLMRLPSELEDKAFIVRGPIEDVVESIHEKGYKNLYIDGGKTIQSFLEHDLIEEMIITTIPILLGEGTPLFGFMDAPLKFKCVETQRFVDHVVQSRYLRIR